MQLSGQAEGQSQAVEEAGKDIVKGIAQELGVSEEEVVKAMEELGLTLFALFEPSNLTHPRSPLHPFHGSGNGITRALHILGKFFASKLYF